MTSLFAVAKIQQKVITLVLVIRIFQFIVVVLTVIHFIKDRFFTSPDWQYFRISQWVFRLCALAAFGLSLGIDAIIQDHDTEQYGIAALFGAACIFSGIMMAIQSIWQIKYQNNQLIFRNSLGISKTYAVNELHIIEQGRMTVLKYRNRTVTKWDSFIMNTKQEIALCKVLPCQ